jgi:Ni/Fe-hydrogenase subunit HybB-like protein
MTSQIHDGLYFANLVFLVGVAAGAVTIVFPAYVYHHKAMHEVTVLGEMLAISAVIMVMLFVFAHMGRPDRLWHMLPFIGIFNMPGSMLAWDVLALNGYLMLNFMSAGFTTCMRKYTGTQVNNKYLHAAGVHLHRLGAEHPHGHCLPDLHHASAPHVVPQHDADPLHHHGVCSRPCLIILAFMIIRKNTKMWIQDSAINLLATIVTWCLGLALFLTMSEIVVELYARTEHANGLYYLMFGLHGLTALVPWFWSSLVFMIVAFVMFLTPSVRRNYKLLPIACVLAFAGIWIEKGMGLIVPGFIPTPIGEVTEYYPTFIEVVMTIGNWAMGFFILTILLKGAIGILVGDTLEARPPAHHGEARIMKKITFSAMVLAFCCSLASSAFAQAGARSRNHLL